MQINYDKTNGFYIGNYVHENACIYTDLDAFLDGHDADDCAMIVLTKAIDIYKFYKWIDRNNYSINRNLSKYEQDKHT